MITDKTNADNAAADDSFTLQEWAMTKPELFDLTAEFKAQVEPMMDALVAKCVELGIAVSITAAYGQTQSQADYHAQGHMPSAARTPHLVLAAQAAGMGNFELLKSILMARELRNLRNQQTTH